MCHCLIPSLRNIGIAAILAGVLLVGTGSIVLAQQADDPDELSRRITELNAAARYAEALPLAQRLSALLEKTLGPTDPAFATSLNDLGVLYYMQARYAEAEALYKRSLAIREKALGHNHPSVALSLNNIGVLYYEQGRYVDAERLYGQSLAIRKKTLEPDHLISHGR
jgi:tetratricopeptide (TPR) repeat protein